MPKTTEQSPAQVPGDAESPPRDEIDRTIEEAGRHIDKTEPTQGPQPGGPTKPR